MVEQETHGTIMRILNAHYKDATFKGRAHHLELLFQHLAISQFLAFISTVPDEFEDADLKWLTSLVVRQFHLHRIYLL